MGGKGAGGIQKGITEAGERKQGQLNSPTPRGKERCARFQREKWQVEAGVPNTLRHMNGQIDGDVAGAWGRLKRKRVTQTCCAYAPEERLKLWDKHGHAQISGDISTRRREGDEFKGAINGNLSLYKKI